MFNWWEEKEARIGKDRQYIVSIQKKVLPFFGPHSKTFAIYYNPKPKPSPKNPAKNGQTIVHIPTNLVFIYCRNLIIFFEAFF